MKKNEKIRYLVIILVLAIIFSGAASYATNYLFDSKDVYFDNTHSEIRAGNVQDALDEVFHHVTDYNEIKALIGDSTLTTTSQTLTGGINELDNNLDMVDDWEDVSVSASFGSVTATKNLKIKIGIVSFNAETGSGDTSIQLPQNMCPAASLYGSIRGGGYLKTDIANCRITVTDVGAWGVGQIIFPLA